MLFFRTRIGISVRKKNRNLMGVGKCESGGRKSGAAVVQGHESSTSLTLVRPLCVFSVCFCWQLEPRWHCKPYKSKIKSTRHAIFCIVDGQSGACRFQMCFKKVEGVLGAGVIQHVGHSAESFGRVIRHVPPCGGESIPGSRRRRGLWQCAGWAHSATSCCKRGLHRPQLSPWRSAPR